LGSGDLCIDSFDQSIQTFIISVLTLAYIKNKQSSYVFAWLFSKKSLFFFDN
jgi:hypothetical protein